MRLIVVDDEEDIQILFKQKFRKEIKSGQAHMYFALNGQSALKIVEGLENPEGYLVLSDINMPEMNGIELLKLIKSKYPKLKVIMITAYGDEQNFNLAKEHGADEYFTKPIEFDILKTKINSLITEKENL
jgi:CheY-like chemotaxis protein